jgi:tetratricopeptide (TPR) repeat protein
MRSRVPPKPVVLTKRADKPAHEPAAEIPWLTLLAQPRLLALVCFLISAGLYANTLANDFTFDDFAALTHNPYVAGTYPFLSVFKLDFWGTATNSTLSHKSYRPLCSILFRLLWTVRTEQTAFVFHLAQVVLNAAASALAVLWVIAPLCQDAPLTRIVAALLYAVHPAKTEAVAGVVGTAEILSALFCFLAFHLFAEKQSPILAGLSVFFASMSKETGVTACLIVALYGLTRKRWVSSIVVVVVPAVLFVGIRAVAFGKDSWSIEPSPQDNPMMMQRGVMYLINAAVVQSKYLQILFWPVNLSCDYSYNAMPLASRLFETQVVLAAGAVVLVAWLAWRSLRDLRILYPLSWYAAPLLPATHVVGLIGTLVAERLLYLPCLGWAWLLGELARRTTRKRPVVWTIGVLVLLVACCGALGSRTMQRNRDWRNNEVLFQETLKVAPKSLKALMNVAGLHFQNSNVSGVIEFTDLALAVDPNYCHALQIKGRALLDAARNAAEALPVLQACQKCMSVRRHSSQLMAEVMEMIAKSLMQLSRMDEAIPWFNDAIAMGMPDANCNLAVLYMDKGRFKDALAPAELCARLGEQPHRLYDTPSLQNAALKLANYGVVLANLKRHAEAIAVFDRAVALDPGVEKRIASTRAEAQRALKAQ